MTGTIKRVFPLVAALLFALVLALPHHPPMSLTDVPHVGWQVAEMAQNPDNLPEPTWPDDVQMPESLKKIPDHIKNHPRGGYTSRLKANAWIKVLTNWWKWVQGEGPPPDWCGKRADGAIAIVYFTAKIITRINKIYEGLGAIVNQGGDHFSTALTKVTRGPDGRPLSGNSSGNDFDPFIEIPCPRILGPITR